MVNDTTRVALRSGELGGLPTRNLTPFEPDGKPIALARFWDCR
jgi:hypothetical protein